MRIKVFSVGLAGIVLLLLVSTTTAGVVNKVFPNGSDDTVNIENAFFSCVSSGPDCTVELAAGTFYIARPIVIANFDGVFRGQGKKQTIIENLHDVPFPLMTSGPEVGTPGMFLFYRDVGTSPNSLRFADFSIQAKGVGEIWSSHDPSNQWDFMGGIHVRGEVSGVQDLQRSHVDVSVDEVSISGEFGVSSTNPFNLNVGINIYGETFFEQGDTILFNYSKEIIGTFEVTNSDFSNLNDGVFIAGVSDSRVVIGGNPSSRNSFSSVRVGVWITDVDNSVVNVSFNDGSDIINWGVLCETAFTAVFGLDLGPVPELFPEPSTCTIHQNGLHVIGIADGISVIDFGVFVGADATVNAVVMNNSISLDNTFYGGIFGGGVQNAFVANNKIEGTGLAGIYFGVFGDVSEGWTLLGNNVQNFEGIFPDFAPGIWLGPWTSNNTVVGGSNHTNVIDEGTNNIITGVNNMGGNPHGPAIAQAIANKTELLQSLRH